MNDGQQFELLVERLRRHYDQCVQTYDQVSLLDLSHSLRMWADAKRGMLAINPKFSSALAFKSGRPSRKVMRALAKSQYVFMNFPVPTITYANDGQIWGADINPPRPSVMGGDFKALEGGGLEVSRFYFFTGSLPDHLKKSVERTASTRCNYSQWLASESVRYRFFDETGDLMCYRLSIEQLVRRVANSMGGSHPSFNNDGQKENALDGHVKLLMKFRLGGLPLPYFILLNTAQMILSAVKPR